MITGANVIKAVGVPRYEKESTARSRLRWLVEAGVVPKGTGGYAGAGRAEFTRRDALMVLLSFGSADIRQAGEYVMAISEHVNKSRVTLLNWLERALSEFGELDEEKGITSSPDVIEIQLPSDPEGWVVITERFGGLRSEQRKEFNVKMSVVWFSPRTRKRSRRSREELDAKMSRPLIIEPEALWQIEKLFREDEARAEDTAA